MRGQQVGGGAGQEQIAGGADVGGGEQRADRLEDGVGQLQAAVLAGEGGTQEAAVDIGIERRLHLRDQVHALAVEVRLVGIELGGVRQELLLGQHGGGVDHVVVAGAVLAAVARIAVEGLNAQPFVQQEVEIAALDQFGHGRALMWLSPRAARLPVCRRR